MGCHVTRFKQWIRRTIDRLPISGACWPVVSIVAMLAGCLMSAIFWGWLTSESNAATIGNVALVVGGVVAILLAMWRSRVAERQTDTAQQGLLNERYQQGAQMLGSEVLSVRLGGIFALQRLAHEHPERYHVQIMRLLCAFVRHPTGDPSLAPAPVDTKSGPPSGIRQDVEAVVTVICSRDQLRIELELREEFRPDLRGAELRGAQFGDADLSGAMLHHSSLAGANFWNTDLSRAYLNYADLSGARFYNVKCSSTSFWSANLSDALLQDANLSRGSFHGANLSRGNLGGANLSGAILQDAIIANAWLERANLSGAGFLGADLSNARLTNANLSGANLLEANLLGARLVGANMSGTELSAGGPQTARGLTQAQFDQARADPNNPPKLDGVADAQTGEQLVWRGKPIEDGT